MDVSLNNILGHAHHGDIPDRYRSGRYMNALIYRVCLRIASKYPGRFKRETVAGALFIYVTPYIYFCLPMKYIALEARRRSESINIHLQGTLFPIMPMWSYEEVPLFALACFAQRYGVPFRFHNKALETRPVLTFRPSPVLVPDPSFNYEYNSFPSRTLVCTAGYRDFDVLPPGETDISFFWARAGYRDKLPTDTGFRMDPRPFLAKYMEIRMERHADRDFLPGLPTMMNVIDAFFIPVLEASLEEAHKLVREADIRKLYVSDFPFLETSVMKDAVAGHGGKVALVPHGYYMTLEQSGASEDVDTIIVPCRSAAEQWTHHSRATIKVQSMLSRRRAHKPSGPFTPGYSGSIHIFGCHEFIGTLRRLARNTDPVAPYRELLEGLKDSGSNIWFRERKLGVTFAMVQATNAGRAIMNGTVPPTEIEGHNLVFIFVGPFTSGIFEAIGRGIPTIRIHDEDEEEYLDIDKDIVPILSSHEAAALARELANGNGYDDFVEKQRQWFAIETADLVINSPDL